MYASPAQMSAENRAALQAWLGKNRRDLGAPDAVATLAARLAPARVVGIGEATHGTHEDMV